MQAIRKYEIKYHVLGPRRPNENPAKQAIHEVKKGWYCIVLKKNVPLRLWDYGFIWVCEIDNVCANLSNYADGHTPIEIITGETPNISKYLLDFKFYDCAYQWWWARSLIIEFYPTPFLKGTYMNSYGVKQEEENHHQRMAVICWMESWLGWLDWT